jgi:riboflavin kinase/FMN adenylyltransferase
MEIINGIERLSERLKGGVVSLGKFDGMHLGHSQILARVKEYAERLAVPSLVLTFDPPPTALLRSHPVQPLCTLERKIELLRDFGLDGIVVIPTTFDFLRQSAETFFFETLAGVLRAKVVVEGENFSFGHNRDGNAEAMQRFGKRAGIDVDPIKSVRIGERIVSSSEIRRQLLAGDICNANALLTKPYRLTGTVVHGEHRGRTLGFPTANLDNVQTILPKPGTYATLVHCDKGEFLAATHIGANPTFGESQQKIEVFLLDFNDDLYGKTLHIDFLDYLRTVVRFENIDQLRRQIEQDIRQISNKKEPGT